MRKTIAGTAAVLTLILFGAAAPAHAADSFTVDPVHSSVTFKISHLGISWIHGRFNDIAGNFTVDRQNPAQSSFGLASKIDSVDTNNKARDKHLRSPDFFNATQYPFLAFKSTSVKPVAGGYEVRGDLTLHGVTKSISFTLKGGKEAEFPKGTRRIGFATELKLKRSDFGMTKGIGPVGDEVDIAIAFEGVKK